jgi:membrane protein YqaA with SNARE-associated domain
VDIPFLRRAYAWMLRAAAHPKARGILFGVSVAEASVFPIPQEVMLVPMVAAQPAIWWRVGLIATAGSVIGGLIGYLIGWGLYEAVAVHIIEFYRLHAAEARFRDLYEHYGWLVVAIAAVTPIPYKMATIASGMVLMPLAPFLLVCLLARGLRHLAVAWIAARFGPPILAMVEKRLALWTVIGLVVLVGGFLFLKVL